MAINRNTKVFQLSLAPDDFELLDNAAKEQAEPGQKPNRSRAAAIAIRKVYAPDDTPCQGAEVQA